MKNTKLIEVLRNYYIKTMADSEEEFINDYGEDFDYEETFIDDLRNNLSGDSINILGTTIEANTLLDRINWSDFAQQLEYSTEPFDLAIEIVYDSLESYVVDMTKEIALGKVNWNYR